MMDWLTSLGMFIGLAILWTMVAFAKFGDKPATP